MNRGCYERFVSGAGDEWEVLKALRTKLRVADALQQLGVLDVIVLTLPGRIRLATEMEEFSREYTAKSGFDEAAATEAHRWFSDLRSHGGIGFLPSLADLHKTIEIAKPA